MQGSRIHSSDNAAVMGARPVDHVARIGMAAALAVLGLLNFCWRDTLLQWQPLPVGSALRFPVAMLSGALLMTAGCLLIRRERARLGAIIAASWILIWTLTLQLPAAFQGARSAAVGALGIAETLAIALGLAPLIRPLAGKLWWRIAFGTCLITFGLSHFVFAQFTAAMVPGWIPAPLFVAYLTGAIHAATGMATIAAFAIPRAAALEAAMMTAFVLLLHVPRVLHSPTDRIEQTMLAIAFTLAAATWLVAMTARDRSRVSGA